MPSLISDLVCNNPDLVWQQKGYYWETILLCLGASIFGRPHPDVRPHIPNFLGPKLFIRALFPMVAELIKPSPGRRNIAHGFRKAYCSRGPVEAYIWNGNEHEHSANLLVWPIKTGHSRPLSSKATPSSLAKSLGNFYDIQRQIVGSNLEPRPSRGRSTFPH